MRYYQKVPGLGSLNTHHHWTNNWLALKWYTTQNPIFDQNNVHQKPDISRDSLASSPATSDISILLEFISHRKDYRAISILENLT